jgi:hypothetical protein
LAVVQNTLTARRDELIERFDDAVSLKSGIDRRRRPLDQLLRAVLNDSEMDAYARSIEASCRARLEAQWIEDRIEVAKRQLSVLDVAEDLKEVVDEGGKEEESQEQTTERTCAEENTA